MTHKFDSDEEFPCKNCIVLAQCIARKRNENIFYYIAGLMRTCKILKDYIISGEYYTVNSRRRGETVEFFESFSRSM